MSGTAKRHFVSLRQSAFLSVGQKFVKLGGTAEFNRFVPAFAMRGLKRFFNLEMEENEDE